MERRPRRKRASYAQKYHSAPAGTMAHCSRTLAGFLTPPQTYELCQTAKAFHVKENGVPRATRALRVSLETSLARVLKARGVSPEALDFKALVDTDGDGHVNFCEYKWDTNPRNPVSYPGQGELCDPFSD